MTGARGLVSRIPMSLQENEGMKTLGNCRDQDASIQTAGGKGQGSQSASFS